MRVIPVIDLKSGAVVRAVAGSREHYRPIQSSLVSSSVPGMVARAFRDKLQLWELYVADLDAIGGAEAAFDLYTQLTCEGSELLIDAGISDLRVAERLSSYADQQSCVKGIIVGLESVDSWKSLRELASAIGPDKGIFSLDLMQGRPFSDSATWSIPLTELVRFVVESNFRRLIVLDLADVGTAGGTSTVELCGWIRAEFPALELIAGGGVRGPNDLARLAGVECDAALVASALHDGQLTTEHLAGYRPMTR